MKKQRHPNEWVSVCMASAETQKACITSLAVRGNLIYVGSHSGAILIYQKSIDGFQEFARLDCKAPVKALVTEDNRVFGGLQNTNLIAWRQHPDKIPKPLTRLPTLHDRFLRSVKPGSYVQTRRHHKRLWIRHADAVTCLAVSIEDGVLYSGSWDKTVKVWRLSDFKCVESINAHEDAVNDICCARQGGMFFTASADGTVRVWSGGRGGHKTRLAATLVESSPEQGVNCLVLSRPDESILYCGTSAGRVNFWTIDTSLQTFKKASFSAHKRSVLCLTTVEDIVCSGSADWTIRVWGRTEGMAHTCLLVLEGHSSPVKCLTAALPFEFMSSSFSSSSSPCRGSFRSSNCHLLCDGFVVHSGSVDGTLKMWWVGNSGCKVCVESGQSVLKF